MTSRTIIRPHERNRARTPEGWTWAQVRNSAIGAAHVAVSETMRQLRDRRLAEARRACDEDRATPEQLDLVRAEWERERAEAEQQLAVEQDARRRYEASGGSGVSSTFVPVGDL